MDQILYINSASIEDLSVSASLVSAPGSNIDFSQSTQVSGSFVGNLVGTASYALVTNTAISASHAVTASYVSSASFATTSQTATSASYAGTASVASTATSASFATSASWAATAASAGTSATASYVSAQSFKAGIAQGAWFSGNPKKYTVNFTSSFANTNYSIMIIGQVSRTWIVEAQTSSSFIINSNGNQAFTGPVYWHAVVSGEYNS
jgi:hypothetical protein